MAGVQMHLKTIFKTDKIHLRPFEEHELPKVKVYLNNYDFIGTRGLPWDIPDLLPLSEKQIGQIISKWAETKNELHLAIILNETGEIIGHVEYDWGWDAFSPGMNIIISPNHRKRGYGSTVLKLLLAFVFNYSSAHSISCWVPEWNILGCKFLEKHFFKDCGQLRRAGIFEGKFFDYCIYNILKHEWKKNYTGGLS
ncbi:MAG: N-acetyltransferase [Candidatus Heimdallarchaeota archaeon]|nr:N-acetyltransferase [Candidatus Heimdallarchaeota archaeon]